MLFYITHLNFQYTFVTRFSLYKKTADMFSIKRVLGTIGSKGSVVQKAGCSMYDEVDWGSLFSSGYTRFEEECWAEVDARTVEATYAIQTENQINLSVSYLVDNLRHKDGGGFVEEAYAFMAKFGLPREKDYPNYPQDHPDYLNKIGLSGLSVEMVHPIITDFYKIDHRSNHAIVKALTKRPITVSVDLPQEFEGYRGDLIRDWVPLLDKKGRRQPHTLSLIGSGYDEGMHCWKLLHNLFDPEWGEGGEARARSKSIFLDAYQPKYEPHNRNIGALKKGTKGSRGEVTAEAKKGLRDLGHFLRHWMRSTKVSMKQSVLYHGSGSPETLFHSLVGIELDYNISIQCAKWYNVEFV